jgi:uncharacterized protein (DUF1501 family)
MPLLDPRGVAGRRLLRLFGAGLASSLAWPRLGQAQAATDYRALVCVLMEGGNDGENTLIRYDSAGYARYAAVRPAASGLNIAQSTLLPIQPASQTVPYGFHPACAGLQSLFEQKKLAVLANVGTLVRPVTRAGLLANGDPRPSQLFNHSDQVRQAMTADATDLLQSGWGGRIADQLGPLNAGNLFPAMATLGGPARAFGSGNSTIPLALPIGDFFALANVPDFNLSQLRNAAQLQMLAEARDNLYDSAARTLAEKGLQSSDVVNPIFNRPVSPAIALFDDQQSDIGRQLRQVARLIEARADTGLKRQVFFVRQAMYDTHVNQAGDQSMLLGNLSRGLTAFNDAMKLMGVDRNVTVFTLSDFGRTLKPAANAGTDHGWGNYAFVLGGSVRGGDFYGKVPVLALGGPDDLGDDGRWIPTTSIEQYGATLARWLGLDAASIAYAFPNLPNFSAPDLGFLAPV